MKTINLIIFVIALFTLAGCGKVNISSTDPEFLDIAETVILLD